MKHQSSLDDGALVAAALRDKQAFSMIVRRYEPPLSRYVRRLLGTSGQAVDDVLQDAFIKVYVNLNDYDRSRPFSPWIYRIARNEAMSFLRKRRTEPYLLSGEEGMVMLERALDEPTVLEVLERSRIGKWIRKLIAGLDPSYRDVFVLRYLEEKSYEEISEILEIPMGTVATYINRGKRRLKRDLDAIGIEP